MKLNFEIASQVESWYDAVKLVHLFYLGGFKLTKFVSHLSDLANQIDGSAQSTEPKVIVSSNEKSMQVVGL